jgi:hypothetical protein
LSLNSWSFQKTSQDVISQPGGVVGSMSLRAGVLSDRQLFLDGDRVGHRLTRLAEACAILTGVELLLGALIPSKGNVRRQKPLLDPSSLEGREPVDAVEVLWIRWVLWQEPWREMSWICQLGGLCRCDAVEDELQSEVVLTSTP